MKRVFVSYSRNNQVTVQRLIHDIKAIGVEPWYDETLTGGQRWWENILSNIRDCDIFVFAVSPDSCDSEACQSELDYASRLGKNIIPVLVADGVNLRVLPHSLSEIQVTDYRRSDRDAALALVRAINAVMIGPPLPDPLPAPPGVPLSYLVTLRDRIDNRNPLSAEEQINLVFDLKNGTKEGRSRNEIKELLLRLKRREDLLAKVAAEIDKALRELGPSPPPSPGPSPAVSPPPSPFRKSPQSCPNCKASNEFGARFCAVCGKDLATQKYSLGAKSREYPCSQPDEHVPQIIGNVKSWLEQQDFELQQFPIQSEGVLLQIKKRGTWRAWVGMSTALNIIFHSADDRINVEIGGAKWTDKIVVGIIGVICTFYVFGFPLVVTASIGAWEQMQMPDRILDYIGTRVQS